MGTTYLGDWGEVPGWVVFMSIDIITGNVWGIWTGEWNTAPKIARRLLNWGMIIILIAIGVVAVIKAIKVKNDAADDKVLQESKNVPPLIFTKNQADRFFWRTNVDILFMFERRMPL